MTSFYVESMDEFLEMVKNKDLSISKALIGPLLSNLEGKKRHIHVIDIYIKDEDRILEITVDRRDFLDTLEKNLIIQETHEEYEACIEIQKAIEFLKNNQNETL